MNNSQPLLPLTRFESFRQAVRKLGVIDFSKMIKIQEEIEVFEDKGLDADLSDIFPTNKGELFTVLRDGSIRKTVIHIVDISNRWKLKDTSLSDLILNPEKLPKFHIYECKKIKEMKEENRGYRYKASGRSDGFFLIIRKIKEREEKCYPKLHICQFCLDLYNEQFETDKINKTKQTFLLKEYMKKPIVHNGFKNMPLDICTIPNKYTKSWREISKTRKKQENWRCQSCGGDLSKKECREFLHTHHINADKRDNCLENLKVLCIECHSKEHNHGHIKNHKQYKKFKRSGGCLNI